MAVLLVNKFTSNASVMHLSCKKYTFYGDVSNKDNEVAARRSWQQQASKQASKQANKQAKKQTNKYFI
jgi:hypothetical protein